MKTGARRDAARNVDRFRGARARLPRRQLRCGAAGRAVEVRLVGDAGARRRRLGNACGRGHRSSCAAAAIPAASCHHERDRSPPRPAQAPARIASSIEINRGTARITGRNVLGRTLLGRSFLPRYFYCSADAGAPVISLSEPDPTALSQRRVIRPALFALRRIGLRRAWGRAQAIKGPAFAVRSSPKGLTRR